VLVSAGLAGPHAVLTKTIQICVQPIVTRRASGVRLPVQHTSRELLAAQTAGQTGEAGEAGMLNQRVRWRVQSGGCLNSPLAPASALPASCGLGCPAMPSQAMLGPLLEACRDCVILAPPQPGHLFNLHRSGGLLLGALVAHAGHVLHHFAG
jgi:hypothetical protein